MFFYCQCYKRPALFYVLLRIHRGFYWKKIMNICWKILVEKLWKKYLERNFAFWGTIIELFPQLQASILFFWWSLRWFSNFFEENIFSEKLWWKIENFWESFFDFILNQFQILWFKKGLIWFQKMIWIDQRVYDFFKLPKNSFPIQRSSTLVFQ